MGQNLRKSRLGQNGQNFRKFRENFGKISGNFRKFRKISGILCKFNVFACNFAYTWVINRTKFGQKFVQISRNFRGLRPRFPAPGGPGARGGPGAFLGSKTLILAHFGPGGPGPEFPEFPEIWKFPKIPKMQIPCLGYNFFRSVCTKFSGVSIARLGGEGRWSFP